MDMVKMKIEVERVLFPKDHNPQDEFAILGAKVTEVLEGDVVENKWGSISLKGTVPLIDSSIEYTVLAKEFEDPTYGMQYEIVYMGVPAAFNNEGEKRDFLDNVFTPNQVSNLYSALKDPVQTFLDEDIEALKTVKGIGDASAKKMLNKFKSLEDLSLLFAELPEYGLTINMIRKLLERYGTQTLVISKVKENPYVLIADVDGIGWKKADSIAMDSGMSEASPFRMRAFITHYLKEEAQKGNSYIFPQDLMSAIKSNLTTNIPKDALKQVLHELKDENVIVWNDDKTRIGLTKYKELESNIANEIMRLLEAEPINKIVDAESTDNIHHILLKDAQKNISNQEISQGWEFTKEQRDGIFKVLNNQVSIITGLSGTGKSSVVSGVLSALNSVGYSFAQTALSGKAASRLMEVTGEEGYTIHRLLGYDPKNLSRFMHNRGQKLCHDIIIVDEVSMIGGELFYKLIQSVKDGAKVILLGDAGQLESIGTLNLFADLIECEKVPVVKLTKIHRQAEASAIITEAHKIRHGIQITTPGYEGEEVRGKLKDLHMHIVDELEECYEGVIERFEEEIQKLHNNDILNLQVIVPMKSRGDLGSFTLNNELQSIYNPYDETLNEVEISYGKDVKYTLREGDKIINVKNNYSKCHYEEDMRLFDPWSGEPKPAPVPIYNGYMGIVKKILSSYMLIDFQGIGLVRVPRGSFISINLGYAVTCHKFQGSQSHTVIVGLDYAAFKLLTRQWVYTALTRVQKMGYLIAQNEALRKAIDIDNIPYKLTYMKDLLSNDCSFDKEKYAVMLERDIEINKKRYE